LWTGCGGGPTVLHIRRGEGRYFDRNPQEREGCSQVFRQRREQKAKKREEKEE
jgi:hypothetical protein